MKKLFFTYCSLSLSIICQGQKLANNWYFGNKAGLDFNHSPVRPLVNTGKATSFEGTASISDNNGKLLFYTNGIHIINKQQQYMKNGDGLRGDQSSTNNAVIAPMPGSDSIYYVFTVGAALLETHVFCYNIVNIKGDAGLGEVTSKNVVIEDNVFEKIAAVKHCNNKDIWIVVHKWETNEYHAYLLTAAGLNPIPVVSHAGLVITGFENNEIGTLKFSSGGKKLAAIYSFDNDAVQLMDFNNITGVISNPVIFHPNTIPRVPSYKGVYGAEFSADGRLLYVSSSLSLTEPSILYQFDISSGDANAIFNTRQVIASTSPWQAGALQIGPDSKIYMAMWKDTSVSVIENPNVYGNGCNFSYNKIYMGTVGQQPVQFGLPNFIQSYFDTVSNSYDFSRSGSCLDRNVAFKINRLTGIDSVKWDFGDLQQSTSLQPLHSYANYGLYDVKLIVYKVDCSGLNDTIKRKIWIADSKTYLGNDTSGCSNLLLKLGVDEIYGANYLWSNDSLSNYITTNANGLYWLEIEQNGCRIRDTINVSDKPKPFINAGPDTVICNNKPVTLNAGNNSASNYLWSTGETTFSITINKPGIYWATVTESSCVASDTVIVVPGDCDMFIPNAFTPNDDGINDQFGIANTVAVQDFSMKIYNRYGQVVFSTNIVTGKWDGKYKGKKVAVGSYPWSIIYINGKGYTKWLKGTVLVLH